LREHAVDEADKLLLAFGRGADDDQQALRGIPELTCTWMPSTQQ